METVINFISEHYPLIALFLALLGIAVVVTYKVVVYHISIQVTKQKVDDLPCGLHGQLISNVEKDIAVMKNTLSFALGMKDVVAKKRSPVVLTEIGEDLVAENNLHAMVDRNWGKISKVLNNLKTRNPYDLEQFCLDTALTDTLFDAPEFLSLKDVDKLKRIAYNSPYPLHSITRAIAVLIRDRYFIENNIDISETYDE